MSELQYAHITDTESLIDFINLGCDKVIRAATVMMTPEMATTVLAKFNTDNFRSITKSKVSAYARKMEEGAWHGGRAIEFGWDAVGIDLQHRLSAVIRSGVPTLFTVVVGMDPQAKFTADLQGSARLAGQILKYLMDGSFTGLSTAIRTLISLEEIRDGEPTQSLSLVQLSGEDWESAINSREGLRENIPTAYELALHVAKGNSALRGGNISQLAGLILFMLNEGIPASRIQDWIDSFKNGGSETSPSVKAANRVASVKGSSTTASTEKLKAYIHGYNKWRAGESVSQLTLPKWMPTPTTN